ncbi:hypothetical protein DPMN_112021 [Dreissena polymorpha]|uniref:Uncharacterized protein n=1 Tax=Dreissena polymorpha TaxID=45954 RepID=A0A9D4KEW1_DREPO|nr:hypothetical protein DPMN_112021 [Dreissena polymorpha]
MNLLRLERFQHRSAASFTTTKCNRLKQVQNQALSRMEQKENGEPDDHRAKTSQQRRGETKIDSSFPDAQFEVNNYHVWRSDRTVYGGGLIAYLRSDLAGDRKKHLISR